MDAILSEATIHQRKQALGRMTNGLGLQDAYSTTLNRIRQQGGSKARLGMEVLMWISRCERALKSEELCNALGVELGAEDINIRNVPSIRTVLGCTLGLVRMDENTSTLRLLHYTLQEYLGQHPTLFVTAHSMMAEICLTYLNFRSIRESPPNLDRVVATPFLEYATCFWGTHAAREVTESVNSLAVRLLKGYENHVSAATLWRKMRPWYSREHVSRISGLHCMAYWGIAEIATTMLEMQRWDVNGRDSRGNTPLMWAIQYGNDRVVGLLLEQEGIRPNIVTHNGRTAFSFAAEFGREHAAKRLFERADINPDLSDSEGRTPLSYAVGKEPGHESIVKLLLERGDVNPNSADHDGRTPLSYAACWGSKGVVKLLLGRADVKPDLSDSKGRTPLSHAVGGEHGEEECTVRLLLERGDVDPNSTDESGRTPLSHATEWKFESAVKLLLEREDVNPNLSDSKGRTPLLYAVYEELEKEGIVKLLLERGDVHLSSTDHDGRTPLSYAAEWGFEGVVKLLLEREDVDPNLPDSKGRTPLFYAVSQELEQVDIVNLLLERGDVDPNSMDHHGRTPLSHAVRWRYDSVVKLLLEQCSQRARGPTGPGGRTAKSPGPDGTAENMPSSSTKYKDGRLE